MKQHDFTLFYGVCLSLFFFSKASSAYSWPMFYYPKKELLLLLGYIETDHCPYGKGKIKPGVKINIREHLCHSFCPSSWEWVAVSDNQCYDLATAFNFQYSDADYIRDEDGSVSYSTITSHFGQTNGYASAFKFVFTTTPGDHWYCVQDSLEPSIIICANDI